MNKTLEERSVALFSKVAVEEVSWPPPSEDEIDAAFAEDDIPRSRDVQLWSICREVVPIIESLFRVWELGRWAREIQDEALKPHVWFFRPDVPEDRWPQFAAFAFGDASDLLPGTIARFMEGEFDAPDLHFRMQQVELTLGLDESSVPEAVAFDEVGSRILSMVMNSLTIIHGDDSIILIPIMYDSDDIGWPENLSEYWSEDVNFRHHAIIREWFSRAAWRDSGYLFGGQRMRRGEFVIIVRDAFVEYGNGRLPPEVMEELEIAAFQELNPEESLQEEWPEIKRFVETHRQDDSPFEGACATLLYEAFHDHFPYPFKVTEEVMGPWEERELYENYESQQPKRLLVALYRLVASSLKGFSVNGERLQDDPGLEALIAKLMLPHVDRVTGWIRY